jgi:GMP synthase-like glutamine amidotransferase
MKHIHYFQHVPFENLGAIETWARQGGHTISATQFYEGQQPPDMDTLDWLIVMGGPMGVHDDLVYPWLVAEKKAIAQAIAAGKVVLGICLGAQLIAHVLGAEVVPNAHKEIGWFPIQLSHQMADHPMVQGFPSKWDTFHWHGDTFFLPDEALPVAASEACQNQGFIYGGRVVGLQFHMEMTRQSAAELVRQCAQDLSGGPFVQSEAQILDNQAPYAQNHDLLGKLLDYLDAVQ